MTENQEKTVEKNSVIQRNGSVFRKISAAVICGGLIGTVMLPVSIWNINGGSVFAADSVKENSVDLDSLIPSGIAGVLAGVSESSEPVSKVDRIGTSAENVIVGQRVATVGSAENGIDVSSSMADQMDRLASEVVSGSSSASIMSDDDYYWLLRIVESEAGEDDIKGRILVGNVIMNRVKSDDFPNNITEVVFQTANGVPQFSPTYDGKIYSVTVTDETREAVRQVMEGVDYSEGALFFIQKDAAETQNIKWFERDLKYLFKHGVHQFYTYPENLDMQTGDIS